jgi:hypothetical protein
MDLKLTPRGRFAISNGRFEIITSQSELLSQYLNAVLTDNIRANTFPSIRASEVRLPSKVAKFKIDVQQRIIEIIRSSPFSYDFEAQYIQVDVQRAGEDSVFVGISYSVGNGKEANTSFVFDGGRLVLPEELERPFSVFRQERIIEEEAVVIEPTDEVDVSCEPSGTMYICNEKEGIKTEKIEIDLKSFPDRERIIKRNVELPTGFYETIGSSQSRSIAEFELDPEGNHLLTKSYDSFIFSTFLKNRGPNFKLIDVRVISGLVNLIRYVPKIEEWVMEVPLTQEFVTLEIDYLNTVTTAELFRYSDIKTYGTSDQYPFREEEVRGRKFYKLDTILNPGIYSVFYRGFVKDRYNGSIEEV